MDWGAVGTCGGFGDQLVLVHQGQGFSLGTTQAEGQRPLSGKVRGRLAHRDRVLEEETQPHRPNVGTSNLSMQYCDHGSHVLDLVEEDES